MSATLAAYGRERHLADLTVSNTLIARLPSRGMTVPVTNLPFTGRHRARSSGSTTVYRSVQFNSPLSLKRRRVHAGGTSQVTAPYTEQFIERPVLPYCLSPISTFHSPRATDTGCWRGVRSAHRKLTADASCQMAGQSTAFRAPGRFAGSGSQTRAELDL
jgi:hypothetical protein